MFEMIFLVVWLGSAVFLSLIASKREWHRRAAMLRLYLLVSWALVTLGAIQVLATPIRFRNLPEEAVWFAAAGFAVALTGSLNLLNLRARLEELVLKRVCLTANLVITILFVAIATHRGAEPVHDPISAVMLAVGIAATTLCRRPVFQTLGEGAS